METVIKALKDLHGIVEVKAGETASMDEARANFHAKRGNVEIVKTKELKLKKDNGNNESN
jgi:hypothetical protein